MTGFVRLFPLWVTLGSVAALVYPPAFTWFLPRITPGLQVIMFGMGITLVADDFIRVARAPRLVFVGVALQFTVMPALGFAVSRAFDLSPAYTVGLILVACCPGGTASNVITYLARADVALSVSMTAVSTLLASLLTPALATMLIGDRVDVDGLGMLVTVAKVAFVPVILGLAIRHYAPRVADRLLPIAPAAAVIAIVLIVGAILGKNADTLVEAGGTLTAAVILTHGAGFAIAFALGGLLSGERPRFGTGARTLSIEVGMQNSGLASVLTRQHFPALPLAPVPSAISAVCHCLIGSALAAVWGRRGPPAAIDPMENEGGDPADPKGAAP